MRQSSVKGRRCTRVKNEERGSSLQLGGETRMSVLGPSPAMGALSHRFLALGLCLAATINLVGKIVFLWLGALFLKFHLLWATRGGAPLELPQTVRVHGTGHRPPGTDHRVPTTDCRFPVPMSGETRCNYGNDFLTYCWADLDRGKACGWWGCSLGACPYKGVKQSGRTPKRLGVPEGRGSRLVSSQLIPQDLE